MPVEIVMTLFCGACYLCVFCALYEAVRIALALIRLGRQIADVIGFLVPRSQPCFCVKGEVDEVTLK